MDKIDISKIKPKVSYAKYLRLAKREPLRIWSTAKMQFVYKK